MEELDILINKMIEAGESEADIALVIQSYNGEATPVAPVEQVKKKETLESPSPSVEDGLPLDGSEPKQDLSKLVEDKAPRVGGRNNEDGTHSSHLMAQQDNVAFPTLFQNEDGSWEEIQDFNKARKEAEKRGEVFKFDSEQEAMDFAEGAWKEDSDKETPIDERPDEIVDEPIAQLYNQYKEEGKIKPDQVTAIQRKLEAQEEGDRGFLETAIAMTEGFLKTGVAIPLFQYDDKEDLVRGIEQKNKTDFLSDLPEETLNDLKQYAGASIGDLEDSNLNILAENKMMEERGKQLVNELKRHATAIKQLQADGQPIPEDGANQYRKLSAELDSLAVNYNENFNLIENNNEDIGDFFDEVNLLKKNYGGLDYYTDLTGLTASSIEQGAKQFEMSTIDFIEDKVGINVGLGTKEHQAGVKKDIKERRDFANKRMQEDLRPKISVHDIESGEDFMAWLGEQVASQLPVLTVLGATGGTIGLGILGASAGGQKIGELQDARIEARETLTHLNKVLKTDLSADERAEVEKSIKIAERTEDISDDEMYMAGIGATVLEIATERVTLGILAKGKRAFIAGKKAGKIKDFGKGIGRGVYTGGKEGGAEFVNAFGGNLIDILYLNDPDTHIFDGTVDALASGFAMGIGMQIAPAAMGMGAKAFMPKETTKEIKGKAQKASDILGEVEKQGDKMDKETKRMMVNKANKLKREIGKSMKGAFDDLVGVPREDIGQLLKLDKSANKILARIDNLKKQDIDPDMKEEFILELKAEADAIIAKKQEILDKNGIKPKTEKGTVVKDGKEGQEVQGETVEDTSEFKNVDGTIRLKREAAGHYEDYVNDYSVKKEGKEWVVKTKPFEKGGKKVDSGTELFRARTLKEAAAYLNTQTKKREAIIDSQIESESVFETTDDGKSKFNWRKLLTGVPFVSYLDEQTFTRASDYLEKKFAELTSEALQGELAFDSSKGNLVVRRTKALGNIAVNRIVRLNNALYSGAGRTAKEMSSKRQLSGFQEMSLIKGRLLTKELSDLISSDMESAKRVHQALDPEIYDETVSYDDLLTSEKTLFNALRAINQQTHEMNFKNGFISKETFDKYDGKYIGRGYEVYEGLEEDIARELLLDNKIFGKIYKKRQDVEQWIIDNTVSDPIYLTMNRAIRSERNAIIKDYADFIEGKYARKEQPKTGHDTKFKSKFIKSLTGQKEILIEDVGGSKWVQLQGKSYGSLDGQWIPSHIAEDFKGYFFNNGFLDALHGVSDIYNQTIYKQFMKRWHTVYSPLVQIGNFMSNHAFAFGAGINAVQLYREMGTAGKELISKTGDYQLALQEGLIGSNVLDKDLRLSGELADQLSTRGKTSIKRMDDAARRLYATSDNIMKLSAYKALKRAGYSHAEATERVYQGFQNYASVGKLWDLSSKLPIWGSDYVKFQGDLNRIVKNAATKRPMSTLTFLYGLQAVASGLSRLTSDESEEEQAIREGRKYIPKIGTPIGDFPLVFRIGNSEVNVARYVSPFYKYDRDNSHWVEKVSEFAPIKIGANEETGELRVVPSDVATGSIWAAFMDNKDFRDKLISDPDYNIYSGSSATDMEKLVNRVTYVLRSQVPLFSFGHDIVLAEAIGEDFYGRDKTPLDVILSRIVKVQTWDKSTTLKQIEKEIKGINYKVKKIKTKESALKNRYNKEVAEANKRKGEGVISEKALQNKLEKLEKVYEGRLADIAGQQAIVQEKFNNLSNNAKEAGINFNALMMKSKK